MNIADLIVLNTAGSDYWYEIDRFPDYGNRGRSYPSVGGRFPPLEYFAELVFEMLRLRLRNAHEHEVVEYVRPSSSFEVLEEGYFANAARHVSRDLASDARLELTDELRGRVRFFGDLRIFGDAKRHFLRGPAGDLVVPDPPDNRESFVEEVSERTGSTNGPIAFDWLTGAAPIPGPTRDPSDPEPIGSPAPQDREGTAQQKCAAPTTSAEPGDGDWRVFLSHSSRDLEYAEPVYALLTEAGVSTFMAEKSLPRMGSSDYMRSIDNALAQVKHMILVSSSVENLTSSWVEAEWRVFINEKRSGRKTGNFLSVLASDIPIEDVPLSIRYYEIVPFATREDLASVLAYTW